MRYSKRRLDSSANERCREEVIADQVLKEFRTFAARKHGRLYNALKPEVELALTNHLENEKRCMILKRSDRF